jgi:hypothetical protein
LNFYNIRVLEYLTNYFDDMKKKICYLACLVLIAFMATSCGKIAGDCKNCKKVYYINGTTYDHEDPETQYCGTDLITVESTPPQTVGSYTVKWECN